MKTTARLSKTYIPEKYKEWWNEKSERFGRISKVVIIFTILKQLKN
jgi:hypothetical protein